MGFWELTCVGITGAMVVTGAGDAVGEGTPTRYLSFVSQSTEFTELACVSRGTQAALYPRGWRGEPSLGLG